MSGQVETKEAYLACFRGTLAEMLDLYAPLQQDFDTVTSFIQMGKPEYLSDNEWVLLRSSQARMDCMMFEMKGFIEVLQAQVGYEELIESENGEEEEGDATNEAL